MVTPVFGTAYAKIGYSHDALHALPTVTVDNPSSEEVFTTGGPNLSVQWTYGQTENDPQAEYRVEVLDDAGTTTFYDSGWVSGAAASRSVDLVDAGVPGDTTDVSVRVSVRSKAGSPSWLKQSALVPFQLEWGIPSLTVTEPDPVENSLTISAAWTYADTKSKAQGHFRVRLLSIEGTVLYDSGWVAGAGTSHAIPNELADDARYKVGIQVKNEEGVLS